MTNAPFIHLGINSGITGKHRERLDLDSDLMYYIWLHLDLYLYLDCDVDSYSIIFYYISDQIRFHYMQYILNVHLYLIIFDFI